MTSSLKLERNINILKVIYYQKTWVENNENLFFLKISLNFKLSKKDKVIDVWVKFVHMIKTKQLIPSKIVYFIGFVHAILLDLKKPDKPIK